MKIRSLRLKNWRGHADLTLPLPTDRALVITGPNGSGKTSVLQSLQWLLVGSNPCGQSYELGLLRTGSDKGYVSALLTSGAEVRRNLPDSLEVPGLPKKAGKWAAESHLMALTGCTNKDEVERALRTDLFLTLASKAQSEAFYEILNPLVPLDLVEAKLTELEASTKLPIRATLTKHYGDPSTNLDVIYKACSGARRDQKKRLKEKDAVHQSFLASVEDGTAPPFVREPDPSRKAESQKEVEALSREIGAANATAARQRSLVAKAADIQRRLQAAWPAEKLSKNEAELTSIKTRLQEIDGSGARLFKLQQKRSGMGSECCPTCQQVWPDAQDRAAAALLLDQEIEALLPLAEEEAVIRGRIPKGENLLRQQHALAPLRAQLEEVEAEAAGLEEVDTAELEARLRQARFELRAFEEQAKDAAAYARWVSDKAAASDEVTALTAEVKALEELVTLFGPTGLKAEILRKCAEPIGEQLSGTLSLWDMAARLSPELVLEVERDGIWRPAYACSDGERILVGLALQVWLAQQSGARIILCDRLEALDDENLRVLLASVDQLVENGAVDHAILAGTDLPVATLTLPPLNAKLLEV